MKQKDKQPRTEEHQEDEKKSERHVPSVVQAVLRWICAGLVIPALFFLPKFIGTITAALDGRMWILSIPWTFYTVMELYIFFIRHRKTQTLDSFATENMIHLILSLGAFHFLSLAERIDIRYRRNAIYVWVTLTMSLCVLFLFFDDADHAKEERKEKRKEKRKEEKRKQRLAEAEEKEKKEGKELPFYKKNIVVKTLIDLTIYAIYAAIAVALCVWLYRYVRDFKPDQGEDEINLSHREFEEKAEKVEDYEL